MTAPPEHARRGLVLPRMRISAVVQAGVTYLSIPELRLWLAEAELQSEASVAKQTLSAIRAELGK